MQPAQPARPDLPRFQRTFKNTLQGMLLGFAEGSIPGAVQGAIDPQAPMQHLQQQRATAQANATFASARAAHEVAMAHQADLEYQALPQKLQEESENRQQTNLKLARDNGFAPVAMVRLDEGTTQNAQNAMTALQQIKQQFGGVPSGLLYVHLGGSMAVMKLQDPNAALGLINKTQRAQGLQQITSDAFNALSQTDREHMAKDALNFTNPRDPQSGMASQGSVNLAKLRLATVQAQPGFDGKDALVSALQQTVDHQQAVLDSGAVQEATRAGQAQGAQAQAAQPGTTAAKVAEVQATSGPEAAAAGAKAGAEAAAKFPYELKLKQAEKEQDQGFAVNPKTGQRELVGKADAKEQGLTNWTKVSQGDLEKETSLNAQLNDLQLNTSRFKTALNAMGPLSSTDVANMTHILSDPNVNSGILNNIGLPAVVSMMEQGAKAKEWNSLSPDKQQALIGALRMKNSALLFQKVSTGMGRASKEAMDIEIANMPSPIEGATVGNQKLQAFQENIDQMASRSVKLPWQEQSQDVKSRIEGQAVDQYNQQQAAKPQGKYRSKGPVKVGQNIQIPHTGGLSRVTKVYSDGTFDADQKGF
jgi:hypothetical protein